MSLDAQTPTTSTTTNGPADMTAAEAFAETVGGMLNAGAVAAMMSIGHRLGLFDTMAAMPPATSAAIARRAELSERYVREWLPLCAAPHNSANREVPVM